jgi:hypothetical protein
MVLFQKYVRRFGPSTKMAPTAELSLVAILVGSRNHRTQFWKGAIQGSFHKSLIAIGPVVSEEKIFMVVTFQKYVWHFRPPTKMAVTAELNLT